jgi:hypothetical protein
MAGNRPLGFVYENTRVRVLPGTAKAELRLHYYMHAPRAAVIMSLQRGDTFRKNTARRFRERKGVKPNGKQQDPH